MNILSASAASLFFSSWAVVVDYLLAVALVATPIASGADTLFKCQNQNNRTVYQATKCADMVQLNSWAGAKPHTPEKPKKEETTYFVVATMQANGVYGLATQINGVPVNVMVDTGAAYLTIPEHMAGQFDLPVGAPRTLMSANGVVAGYFTTVKKLQIGRLLLTDVQAVVAPGTAGILLGQSALHMLKVEQSKGSMMLSSL